jgi:hypothetical protein
MLCHEFCNAANAPLGISAYQHTIRTTLQNNEIDKGMRRDGQTHSPVVKYFFQSHLSPIGRESRRKQGDRSITS